MDVGASVPLYQELDRLFSIIFWIDKLSMCQFLCYLKSKGLAKKCALITDGRFSGGSAGLTIGHVSSEAADGGNIALIHNGDLIRLDIPNRKIDFQLKVSELEQRRVAQSAKRWEPAKPRSRKISSHTDTHRRSLAPLKGNHGGDDRELEDCQTEGRNAPDHRAP